jgi:hypothetical protein
MHQQRTWKYPLPNAFSTRSGGYRSWPLRTHNPKVAGSNPAPATMNDEGLADAAAANPFRLPRLHPGIGLCACSTPISAIIQQYSAGRLDANAARATAKPLHLSGSRVLRSTILPSRSSLESPEGAR